MTQVEPERLVGTVARVCELIRFFADESDPEATITSISRELSLPVSTVHRLLHLLMQQGFIERGVRYQSYRVGGELFRIGSVIGRKSTLCRIAEPMMDAVAAQTGEFTMLCLYLPADRSLTVVKTVASSSPLTYQAHTFIHISVAWGASERAILAHLSPYEVQEIHAAAGPSPVTGEALAPLVQFRAELEGVRQQGYACTLGQKVAGAVGLASAVFGPSGKPVASLCLTIPQFRFDPARTAEYGELLHHNAARLSHAIGFLPQPTSRKSH